MKKTIWTMIALLVAIPALANCLKVNYNEPLPLPTEKWRGMTVQFPFEEVVDTIHIKWQECKTGLYGIQVIFVKDIEAGTAEIYTSTAVKRKMFPIRINALSENETQVMWYSIGFGKKRTGREISGWLNGSEKCNGK